jgi:hypothetical protein
MRKIFLAILLLATMSMARGQTFTYRYWVDRDAGSAQTGSGTYSSNPQYFANDYNRASFNVNVSSLDKGLHTLHVQTRIGSGDWGPTRTSYFYLPEATQQLTATKARYWFDHNDYTRDIHFCWWAPWRQYYNHQWNTTVTNGVINLDVSTLSVGLHTLHYQTCSADGTPSPVVTRYLYIPDDNAQLRGIRLWYDDDTQNAQTYMANDGEATVLELDITALEPGTHLLHAQLLDCDNNVIDEAAEEFTVKAAAYITMATTAGDPRYAIGYSSDKGLDFTDVTDVKAWIVNGYTDKGTVLLSRVKVVPPNTGIYLSTDNPGTTVEVPITNEEVWYANLLLPVVGVETLTRTEVIDGVEYTNLVVGTLNGQPAFSLFPETPRTFGPNKSRLRIPSSYVPAQARQAGGFTVEFLDDEASGIDDATRQDDNGSAVYDLQGRRIVNGKKGLYISNGKKIIIK